MVFWGVELKPNKPFKQSAEPNSYTKLHLSQATLGLDVKSKERVVVKCKVGDGPDILLCSLIPGVVESSSLDLLFDQDVVFSLLGTASVHLTGYYMPIDEEDDDDEYDSDDLSIDDDGSEDEDGDSEDNDMPMVEAPSSGVRIEEIFDEEAAEKKESEKSGSKKRKQKDGVTNGSKVAPTKKDEEHGKGDDNAAQSEDVEERSEDEDGFLTVPSKKKKATPDVKETMPQVKAAAEEVLKKDSPKGKKAKNSPGGNDTLKTPVANKKANATKTKPSQEKSTPTKVAKVAEEKAGQGKKPLTRKFANGLEVHEVAMGQPDGQQAKTGKRVLMYYTGKLKNGKIFDSNVGKKPFQFRLGVGEVIKGWDIGVEGMRVGDKRKLVIPPMLAYGAEGVGSQIPGNSTLTFDVELVGVK